MRSAAKQKVLPIFSNRDWDGMYRWFDEDDDQPRVNNYKSVFASNNPHVAALDDIYQRLALGFRSENCMLCHSPTNHAKMKMLEILSSPAHTLAAKDRLPIILRANQMPPGEGISNHETKTTLIDLSVEFQTIANLALAFEKEPIDDNMTGTTFGADK